MSLAFRLFALFCAVGLVCAHGDLHERIAALSARIQKEPGKAELWLQRGELHRQHGEAAVAEADYTEARRLEPALSVVDLARAKLRFEQGDAAGALEPLERYLLEFPTQADARRLRARVLTALGRGPEAAAEWAKVTLAKPLPLPDDFLAEANALAAIGRITDGVAALDAGVRRLGDLPVLLVRATELEIQARQFDAALRRIDEAMRFAARRESWLELRARALAAAGRSAEAAEAARAGLAALELLPASRRETELSQDLARRLRAFLPP